MLNVKKLLNSSLNIKHNFIAHNKVGVESSKFQGS